MFIKFLIVFAIIIAVIYFLYLNGYATLGNKKSVMFIGKYNYSQKEYSASFKACTGQVKRVIKLKEATTVTFKLESTLESGEIKATVTNSAGHNILILNAENPQMTVAANPEKYFLTIEFYKAYGKCKLSCK